MSKGISNIDWANQLENAIRQFVKEKLELIMREEIKNFLEYTSVIPSYIWMVYM